MKRPLLPITKASVSTLSSADSRLLEQLEARVEHSMMDFCVALAEIQKHKAGIFWRERYGSFAEYVRDRFGYKEQHAYRLAAAGAFVLELDAKNIPRPTNEIQARHVINKIPATHRVECWKKITQKLPSKEMTGDLIAAEVMSYRKTLPKDLLKTEKPPRKPNKVPLAGVQKDRRISHELVGKLKIATAELPCAADIHGFITKIEELIDEE
jgi:hypothetical protein